MKRSELKEAIKSEIKSVLSENRYDINAPNSPLGRLNDEYESSGLKGIVDKYGLDVVLMMLSSGEYGDRLNESVLSEQSNNPDFDKKVASFAKKINNEMDYPGGVLEAMKQIKSRLERIISKVEDAKRGGAEEEPLMKMIGLKEEDEPTAADLKKADSVASAANKLQKLVKKMKDKAKDFKAAEGEAKEKIKDELKKMTAEKKKLEKSI